MKKTKELRIEITRLHAEIVELRANLIVERNEYKTNSQSYSDSINDWNERYFSLKESFDACLKIKLEIEKTNSVLRDSFDQLEEENRSLKDGNNKLLNLYRDEQTEHLDLKDQHITLVNEHRDIRDRFSIIAHKLSEYETKPFSDAIQEMKRGADQGIVDSGQKIEADSIEELATKPNVDAIRNNLLDEIIVIIQKEIKDYQNSPIEGKKQQSIRDEGVAVLECLLKEQIFPLKTNKKVTFEKVNDCQYKAHIEDVEMILSFNITSLKGVPVAEIKMFIPCEITKLKLKYEDEEVKIKYVDHNLICIYKLKTENEAAKFFEDQKLETGEQVLNHIREDIVELEKLKEILKLNDTLLIKEEAGMYETTNRVAERFIEKRKIDKKPMQILRFIIDKQKEYYNKAVLSTNLEDERTFALVSNIMNAIKIEIQRIIKSKEINDETYQGASDRLFKEFTNENSLFCKGVLNKTKSHIDKWEPQKPSETNQLLAYIEEKKRHFEFLIESASFENEYDYKIFVGVLNEIKGMLKGKSANKLFEEFDQENKQAVNEDRGDVKGMEETNAGQNH